jgi:hypothetical protein
MKGFTSIVLCILCTVFCSDAMDIQAAKDCAIVNQSSTNNHSKASVRYGDLDTFLLKDSKLSFDKETGKPSVAIIRKETLYGRSSRYWFYVDGEALVSVIDSLKEGLNVESMPVILTKIRREDLHGGNAQYFETKFPSTIHRLRLTTLEKDNLLRLWDDYCLKKKKKQELDQELKKKWDMFYNACYIGFTCVALFTLLRFIKS